MAGLGGLISGIGTGIDAYQAQAQKSLQRQQAIRQLAMQESQWQQTQQQIKQKLGADNASANYLTGALPGAQPMQGGAGPGAPQPPAPPPQTGQPPMPGQPSVPMMQPGQRAQMPPQPQQGGIPGAQPMQPPPAPPQAPPAPPGASGAPQGMQPPQQAEDQATTMLKRIAMNIKNANPGIDPPTLMQAVNQSVEMMKGVQPELKQQMTEMLAGVKQQMAEQGLQMRQQGLDMRERQGDANMGIRQQLLDIQKDRLRDSEKKTAAGTFTPESADLMASLAERGVSLPAGMRSKEQQIRTFQGLLDRNPGKTPDEIADGIKAGQIEFGAQKKETQTAAGIAGKVQTFANELDRNLPLLRAASSAVPRGNWVPLTRLVQSADSSISDPKLKTLKGYINSTLNAYDALAARGGTDKDKRAENRATLLSADGPEAFEAQLKVFENEAKIAKDSAYEATKSPELGDRSGAGAGGATAPAGSAPTATDAKGNTVTWNGTAWVPVK